MAAVVGEQTADWHYAGWARVSINAFDPAYFDEGRRGGRGVWIGRSLDLEDARRRGSGVLVSENFVHNLGARVGDVLDLSRRRADR